MPCCPASSACMLGTPKAAESKLTLIPRASTVLGSCSKANVFLSGTQNSPCSCAQCHSPAAAAFLSSCACSWYHAWVWMVMSFSTCALAWFMGSLRMKMARCMAFLQAFLKALISSAELSFVWTQSPDAPGMAVSCFTGSITCSMLRWVRNLSSMQSLTSTASMLVQSTMKVLSLTNSWCHLQRPTF